MEIKPFCWVLLAFLILPCFVALETHGRRKEEQGFLHDLVKSTTSKPYFGNETNVLLIPQEGSKEKDKIERLPGQPPVNFSQYGGYVTVNKMAGRALFYYFVEAQQSKDTLPLLLWLNGGPGCSSLLGAMEELGPFKVGSDGKTLYTNKFSWNHAANLLFLETPAGVGFSYSNTTSDYHPGDKRTAQDNYVFLVNWLKRFPEYKNRTFYISGESYAGHYIPQLAQTILYHNKKANKTIINFKGIIIGNADIDREDKQLGIYEYLAAHALTSDQALSQIYRNCDFSRGLDYAVGSNNCIEALDSTENDIMNGLYNVYNIAILNVINDCAAANLTFPPKKGSDELDFAQCSKEILEVYMNQPDVQEALHANVTKLTHNWRTCDVYEPKVLKGWTDSPQTVIPILKELMATGLRVWLYSGDTDAVVSFTSTKRSIKKMKLTAVKTAWRAWFVKGEVGGFTEVYEGDLTIATVRGAGHEVPMYQPARSLTLIKNFLDGTPLPDLKSSDI